VSEQPQASVGRVVSIARAYLQTLAGNTEPTPTARACGQRALTALSEFDQATRLLEFEQGRQANMNKRKAERAEIDRALATEKERQRAAALVAEHESETQRLEAAKVALNDAKGTKSK
jgi:hypothetical protein